MPNMRIIFDNLAASGTLTASTEAGALVVENLLTDNKSVGWRATTTSATLTLVWDDPVTVAGVVLPFTNLTVAATIRVRGYTLAADVVAAMDTTAVLACPATPRRLRGAAATLTGANAYAYGGGAAARVWFDAEDFEKIVIDLVDTGNADGYVEAACLVVGDYWSPAENPDSVGLVPVDMTKQTRTDAGNQVANAGPRSRKLPIVISYMTPADRTELMDILIGNGMTVPVYVSLFPEKTDYELERDHQIYGRLSGLSAVSIPFIDAYTSPLEIEEI